jgi:hypothetical protein
LSGLGYRLDSSRDFIRRPMCDTDVPDLLRGLVLLKWEEQSLTRQIHFSISYSLNWALKLKSVGFMSHFFLSLDIYLYTGELKLR